MNKRILALALTACLIAPVAAEERPVAGSKDPRMRTVIYDPGQVVRLSAKPGATLVVSFSADEKVSAVAVSDNSIAVSPRDNFLFLKPQTAVSAQSIIVLTEGDKGTRRYVFEIATPTRAGGKANLYYSVEFTYPDEDISTKGRLETQQSRLAQAALTRGSGKGMKGNPLTGAPNWRYVAQGADSLRPFQVFDDGNSTAFRFSGNTRIPAIFRLEADGRESTVNYSHKGGYLIVGSVAPGWRLRDGDAVLSIWNRAYDPVGTSPDTGTISPNVKRITKEFSK